MREKDEITGLFRNRLADAGMTVRDGFWEQLQEGLSGADAPVADTELRKALFLSPKFYRMVAAASVVLVLGAASAAFWYFSPKEEIKEAFTQVAVLTPEGSLNGDLVQENFPSIHDATPADHKPGMKQPASITPVAMTTQAEDGNESVSVRVSITITQRMYGNQPSMGNGYFNNYPTDRSDGAYNNAGGQEADIPSEVFSAPAKESDAAPLKYSDTSKWALKIALGTSLLKGDFAIPLTAGVTVERSLNDWLAMETGLLYNRLHGDNTLHTLAVPLKLNMTFLRTPKIDLYATAGGAAEKCVAGAADNGFGAQPVQLSVAAGVGMRYKLNERFALFAEPSVSHHFATDSENRTNRTERSTNMNLLCGVRMTY